MEVRLHTFPFEPNNGGYQEQHMRFAFDKPVVQAIAVMRGYQVAYANGDHELGEVTVRLRSMIVNHAPDGPEVVVYATLGLRDYSGSWDDSFSGAIDMCLFAETRRPIPTNPGGLPEEPEGPVVS